MALSRLFVFGLGYSARVLASRLRAAGWMVHGTGREAPIGDSRLFRFDRDHPLTAEGLVALRSATHVLASVPPDMAGDPVLDMHAADLPDDLSWIGYLSTTGVYGDTGGGVVDEAAPRDATQDRSRRRVAAEDGWLTLFETRRLPVHVFRLAGIYGPGRSELDRVRAGTSKRIDRPGHRFGRIHVDDIARVLEASIARPNPGAAYNVTDDEPAEPRHVVEEACRLLGVAPPPLQAYADAEPAMSPMMRSFWRDNRTVANRRLHDELGVTLACPSYREGLRAVLGAEARREP